MITPSFKKFKIEPYKPGKSKVKKLKKVIKLSANESALGMSPKAKKIISNKKKGESMIHLKLLLMN